jgi:signal peptidase
MAEPKLFRSRRLTPPGEYTDLIEGPAVDAAGTLYVVNFRTNGTIGKFSPVATKSAPFAKLPTGSIVSGIRFDREGRMYVADWKKHNVFVFEFGQTESRVYFSDKFDQPNDLAMAADGTIYASDPKWSDGTGRVWRITRGQHGIRGEVMSCDRGRGKKMSIIDFKLPCGRCSSHHRAISRRGQSPPRHRLGVCPCLHR